MTVKSTIGLVKRLHMPARRLNWVFTLFAPGLLPVSIYSPLCACNSDVLQINYSPLFLTMAQNPAETIETIASNGDVILVVGEPVQARLRVSSTTLAGVSMTFDALFRPNLPAGMAWEPKEIPLPKDGGRAMSDICNLLHGKHVDEFLRAPGPDRMLDFAIVVSKYDCEKALRFHSQAILLANMHYYPQPHPDYLGRQMLAAYYLDHAPAFKIATRRLISETTHDFSELLKIGGSDLMPYRVISKTSMFPYVSTTY